MFTDLRTKRGFPSPRVREARGEAGAAVRDVTDESPPGQPPHPRLPPRSGDDKVAGALSLQAGRGDPTAQAGDEPEAGSPYSAAT